MASPEHSQTQPKRNLTYEEMLAKLDELYNERDALQVKLEELIYDIEFLETMIMYRFNKEKVKPKWPR